MLSDWRYGHMGVLPDKEMTVPTRGSLEGGRGHPSRVAEL